MCDLLAPVSTRQLLKETIAMVLAGGQGERLHPLTKDRAKPAVPFGGIYRLIDFTLSNCLNSGIRKINVLTQYKSYSLARHLRMGWSVFNSELNEFLEVIPPQQRYTERWYQGTADAIFQNIYSLELERPRLVLILSGDHIYKMDYRELIRAHRDKEAGLTVACVEAPVNDARRLGVAQVDNDSRITGFQEKPLNPQPMPGDPEHCLASMGVYLFDCGVLVQRVIEDMKTDSDHDFGKNIIPRMIETDRVYAWNFKDENRKTVKYWRDIGTLDSYYDANMDLVQIDPLFNLYDEGWPVRTYQHQRPPAKTAFEEPGTGRTGNVFNSIMSSGCIVSGATVRRSILSPSVFVHSYATIEDSILMENVEVHRHARIRRAIIDKQVAIPEGEEIGYNSDIDRKRFTVTESGLVVIPKGMSLRNTP